METVQAWMLGESTGDFGRKLTAIRLKQAAADPSSLTQDKIIANLDTTERHRLARLRNIGIAVR